jgi:hypothetical protein
MWSDNETQVDLLDFSHLVAAIETIVKNRDLLPATIGVFGEWGSGKSSLMQMMRARLEEDEAEGFLCVPFNGWLFEGYEDAKTALMGTILKEISDSRTLGAKAKQKLEKLLMRVNWMRVAAATTSAAGRYTLAYVAGGEAGLGAALMADGLKAISEEELGKLIKDMPESDQDTLSVREFHQDFAELLDETNIETLVVFIDDLDRCTPDTVIGTLEAIRLFLFAPQTVFLIGADEDLVRHAVQQRFPGFQGDREVGRDYLEKLVQFPVRIPPLSRAELETYINLLFAERAGLDSSQLQRLRRIAVNRSADRLYDVALNIEMVQEAIGEVPPELRESIALAGYLAPVLTTGLSGNPRQTKRFLNTLMMRKRMAESREVSLEIRVLAKLMLLEYFKPETFQALARLQAEQLGKPIELALLEQRVSMLDQDTPSENLADPAEKRARHGLERDENSQTKVNAAEELGGAEPLNETGSDTAQYKLDKELESWLTDSWLREWLSSDPPLAACDLRPYFFFSRDRLEAFGGAARRLNPRAQDVLARITSPSDMYRREGAKKAAALSQVEAASVFSVLAEQVKQQEDLSDDKSELYSLFDLVEARPELKGQMVVMMGHLAEKALAPAHVVRLFRITKRSEAANATQRLLKRWQESTVNPPLATAANGLLQQPDRRD